MCATLLLILILFKCFFNEFKETKYTNTCVSP